MSSTLASFYAAAEAYAKIRVNEARLAALAAELQQLEARAAADRAVVEEFVRTHPGGQRILEEQLSLMRRAGLIEDVRGGPAKRRSRPAAHGGGSDRPRTAAATEAAAAKRRAIRAADPNHFAQRPIESRLALFDEGFARGYRERCERSTATTPFAKGDRSRGWALGAERAAADLATGVIAAGLLTVAPPPTPAEARAAYQAEIEARSAVATKAAPGANISGD